MGISVGQNVGDTKKVHPLLVKAVEDIRGNIRKNLGLDIPFTEGSRWLAAKYYEGKLLTIPHDRIIETYKRERKLRRYKKRCV